MTVAINVRPLHSIADPKPKTVILLKFSSYWCCAPHDSGRKIVARAGSIITDVRVKPLCCTILCCPPDKTKEKEKESAGIRLFKLHLSDTYGYVVGNSAPCVAGIDIDKKLKEGDFLRLDQLNEITETATRLKETLTNETVAPIENGIFYYFLSLTSVTCKLEYKKNDNLQDDLWRIDIKRKSFSQDDIKKEIAKIPFENTLTDDEFQKLLSAVNEALINNKIDTLDCLEAKQIIIQECLKLGLKILTPKALRAQTVVISYFFMKQQIENTASGHEHWGNLFFQYLKDKFGEFPARVAFYNKYKDIKPQEIADISLDDAVSLEETAIKASQSYPSLKASLKQLQYYYLKNFPLFPKLALDKKSSKDPEKMMVKLDNGSLEEFSRSKMKEGISKILTKDALDDQAIKDIIDKVIKIIENSGETEITKKNLLHYVAFVMHSSEVVILKHEIQTKLEKLERESSPHLQLESSPLIRSLSKMPFFELTDKQLYQLYRATQSHGRTRTQHTLKLKPSHVANPTASKSFT